MQRWRGLEDLPGGWGRCVVTIGVFDGVHRGHQALIGKTVEIAKARSLPSVMLTFDPHPSEVIRPGSHPAQLTTLRRKAELVEELGIDVFAVLPFTPELMRLSADEFVHEILVDRLHAAAVVVGENFTFGAQAAGTVPLLRELGRRFGFVTYGAELQGENNDNAEITFSSTYVRSCIDAGDVAAAAEALGRPHRLEGIVVRGDGRGHDLGYPTANLSTPRFAAVPADGVYACWFVKASNPDRRLAAAVSVGTNPTFSGRERTVEAFVLDVDEDFYGQHVALDFVSRLRDQIKFSSPAELIEQIDDDVARTREALRLAHG
ncbi:bifunctional riboflavin kinase/FAD synthetase [Amycolatopsis acidiphila]|uniref:Riboflavin biosynthesis protein n=1 Tax=Amycolatopsis acidiphila TaxID=715473 RepID=A0A557ZY34_9PSEU|nr:bifunctional riboflavin kinase/FAD synthetase [Amycolatopsis acidiphila]TVT16928.1 bifunctional riboflavin kinase/FAD synthetase [Amycolatopsis acidiphila]UIJ62097.1 bifunctional riboflavin kinase/FAD synthetase [Amycolatopsis acidiphila]